MQHVSSTTTVLLKFALSTYWMVFFGTLFLAFWVSDNINVVAGISIEYFRLIILLFFAFGAFFLYWAVMRLKRVEMDEHFFYVTNYFKHRRYPYHQVEKVVEKDYYFFQSIHFTLKEKGVFGDKISFVASRDRLNIFLKEHPEIASALNLTERIEATD